MPTKARRSQFIGQRNCKSLNYTNSEILQYYIVLLYYYETVANIINQIELILIRLRVPRL